MNTDLLLFRRKPEVVFSPDFLALAFGLIGPPSPHAIEGGPHIVCRRSGPTNDGLEAVPFAIAELSFDLFAKGPRLSCCGHLGAIAIKKEFRRRRVRVLPVTVPS